jgi:Outer membrane protein beta-barrel domain
MKSLASQFHKSSLFTTARALALIAVAAGSLSAQAFQIGFKGGVPIFDQFDANSTGDPSFSSSPRRWLVGPTGEFRLRGNLSMEVDALFKRVGFDYNSGLAGGAGVLQRSTTANQLEVPVLFKYKMVSERRFQPYVDFGASLRHMFSLTQRTNSTADYTPDIVDNSAVLKNRNSYGGVFGVGATMKAGKMYVSPEIRYTRWANEAFSDGPGQRFRNNLNQLDFMVGLTF